MEKLGTVDPTTCVYQFIYYEKGSVDTEIIKYFIMHGLGLFIKVHMYVSYMLYSWSWSHNTAVQIARTKNKNLLFLNTHTTVFAWED